MAKALTGKEEGLAALWNFADPNQPGRDASTNGFHGQPSGNVRVVAEAVTSPSQPGARNSVSGKVTDAAGRPVATAVVVLSQGGVELKRTRSGSRGDYRLAVPADGTFDLFAGFGSTQAERRGVVVRATEPQRVDLTLIQPATVSGRISGLDFISAAGCCS